MLHLNCRVFPPTAHYLCTLFAISHSYRSILPASTRLSLSLSPSGRDKDSHQPGSHCFSSCGSVAGKFSPHHHITNYVFPVLIWAELAGYLLQMKIGYLVSPAIALYQCHISSYFWDEGTVSSKFS